MELSVGMLHVQYPPLTRYQGDPASIFGTSNSFGRRLSRSQVQIHVHEGGSGFRNVTQWNDSLTGDGAGTLH